MADSLLLTPQYWRDRATAARVMAEQFTDRNAQQKMYEIARSYDDMAAMAQRMNERASAVAANC